MTCHVCKAIALYQDAGLGYCRKHIALAKFRRFVRVSIPTGRKAQSFEREHRRRDAKEFKHNSAKTAAKYS